ncbi:MAG: LLM class flavin-dependent oxidoreductase [Xanthobacteraceae bacterium]|nr:LLM class flavin-dependent oxidoreductase [Xanthobacteraceae bacterium]QYK45693.1 MAG: LLM class flavin-dependent oxidoreductase [Xanthobacteraceae bacterium]
MTGFPFGISFDGFIPVRDAVRLAQQAEALGACSFWVAEHLGFRESIVTSTAIALGTKQGTVFPTALSPYLRHPMPTAMALSSLAELVPGRCGVAVGVGNPMFLRESGLEVEKPVKAIRDYVAALRSLMSGEATQQEGLTFNLKGARISFIPERLPPVYLAPMGPQMLKLSGAVADGLVLSAGLSLDFIRHSIGIAAEGATSNCKNPVAIKKTAYVYFIVGGEGVDQRTKIRQKLAFLFRNENLRENIKASGLPIDHDAIIAAVAKRDMDGALKLVPDEAAEAFAIVGSAADCRKQVRRYLDAGLDEIILSLVGTPEDKARSLAILGEI